ncbi:hypothetical protein GGF32_009710 [Allomyces javanicus]|nr:hypothetical protein GGF32_009710 [Allomyces javanicus]
MTAKTLTGSKMVHRPRLIGPLTAAIAVLALLVVAGTVAATARRSHPHRHDDARHPHRHHRHDLERYELSEIYAFLADLDAGHDAVPAWIRAATDDGDKDKIPPYDPHPPRDRNPKHPSPPPRHPAPAPDPAPPAPIPAPKPKPIPPPRDPSPKPPPKEPHEPRDPAPRPPPPPPERDLPPEIGGPGSHPPDRDVRSKWNVLQHPETRLLFVPPFLLLILWAAHHAGMWAYAAHQQRHRALVRTHLGGYEPVGAGGHGTARLGGSAAAVPRLGPGRMGGGGGDSDSARRAPDLSRREEAEGEVSRLVREVRKAGAAGTEPSELEREPYLSSSSSAAAPGAAGVRLPAPGGGITYGATTATRGAASPSMSPGFGKGGQEILAMADGAATWDSAPILHPMRLPGTRSRVSGYGEEEPLLESEEAYATPAGTELEPLPEPMHATVPIQVDPVMSIKNAQHVAMMTLLITLAEAVLGTLAATALPAPTRHAEVVGSRTRVLTLLLATWFTLAIGAAWAFAEGFFMSLYDLSKVRTIATLGLIACIVVHGVATERENRARLHDLPSPGLPPVVPGNETVPHLPPDVPSTPLPPPPDRDQDHDHGHAGPHRVVVLKGDAWSMPAMEQHVGAAASREDMEHQESLGGVAVMTGMDGEDGAWSARLQKLQAARSNPDKTMHIGAQRSSRPSHSAPRAHLPVPAPAPARRATAPRAHFTENMRGRLPSPRTPRWPNARAVVPAVSSLSLPPSTMSSAVSSSTNPAPAAATAADDASTTSSSPLSSVGEPTMTRMEAAERAAVALAKRFDDTKHGVNTAACRFAYGKTSPLSRVTDMRGLFRAAWAKLPRDAKTEVLALLPQFDVEVDAETGERIDVHESLFAAMPFKHSVDVYQDYLNHDVLKLVLADSRVPANRDSDEHTVPPLLEYGNVPPELAKPMIHDLAMVRALNGDVDPSFVENNDGWLARVYGEDEGDHVDDWKDKNFEEYWGELQQRKAPGRSDKAGDTALVTLDDLIAAGELVVGDYLVHEKVFVKPEELRVIFMVMITSAVPKKPLRAQVIEHRVNGALIFPAFDDGDAKKKKRRAGTTPPPAEIEFFGVNALETLAFQRSLGGKDATKPNGNAWRSIKRVRNGGDEIKLFQLRVQYSQTHADEIERRAEAKAASVAKRAGGGGAAAAAKGKGNEASALATPVEEPAAAKQQPARVARTTAKRAAAKAADSKSDAESETEAPTLADKRLMAQVNAERRAAAEEAEQAKAAESAKPARAARKPAVKSPATAAKSPAPAAKRGGKSVEQPAPRPVSSSTTNAEDEESELSDLDDEMEDVPVEAPPAPVVSARSTRAASRGRK